MTMHDLQPNRLMRLRFAAFSQQFHCVAITCAHKMYVFDLLGAIDLVDRKRLVYGEVKLFIL